MHYEAFSEQAHDMAQLDTSFPKKMFVEKF